jgi:hypothetical protein
MLPSIEPDIAKRQTQVSVAEQVAAGADVIVIDMTDR